MMTSFTLPQAIALLAGSWRDGVTFEKPGNVCSFSLAALYCSHFCLTTQWMGGFRFPFSLQMHRYSWCEIAVRQSKCQDPSQLTHWLHTSLFSNRYKTNNERWINDWNMHKYTKRNRLCQKPSFSNLVVSAGLLQTKPSLHWKCIIVCSHHVRSQSTSSSSVLSARNLVSMLHKARQNTVHGYDI